MNFVFLDPIEVGNKAYSQVLLFRYLQGAKDLSKCKEGTCWRGGVYKCTKRIVMAVRPTLTYLPNLPSIKDPILPSYRDIMP